MTQVAVILLLTWFPLFAAFDTKAKFTSTWKAPGAPAVDDVLRLRRAGLIPSRIVLSAHEPLSPEETADFTEVLVKPYRFDQLVAAIFHVGRESAFAAPSESPRWAVREPPRWVRPPRRAARARLRLG